MSGKPSYEDLEQKISVLEATAKDAERLQAVLRESEEKFKALTDAMPTAVLLYQDDRWIYANRAAETISGYSVEELLGINFWDIVHPADKALIQEHGRKRQTGEKTANRHEFKIIAKDGAEKWVDLAGTSTMIGGRLAGIIAVIDITERKRSEEALTEEATFRRILFEDSPDGILIINPQTAEFLDFNTAAHQQLGYSREEFAHLRIMDVEVKETAEETEAHIAAVIQNGKADFETLQRTRQGDVRHVHVSAQIVNVQGRPIYHCIWRDITERKQMEEERERLILELQKALSEVKKLSGLLPICSSCKNIRDDQGYWNQIESYIRTHSSVEFSHSICPECAKRMYPEFYKPKQ